MGVVLNENEYMTGLVNMITSLRFYPTNTSDKVRQLVDIFATDALEYGDQKGFLFAEHPTVEEYSATSTLLQDHGITYGEEFINNVDKKRIPLSRIEPFAKQAMIDGAGLAAFTFYVVGLMDSAKYGYLGDKIYSTLLSWVPTVSNGKEMQKNVPFRAETGTNSEIQAARQLNQQDLEAACLKAFDDFQIFTDVFIDIDNTTNNTNFQTAMSLDDLVYIGNAKYLNDKLIQLMVTNLRSDLLNTERKQPQIMSVPQRIFDKNNASEVIGFVASKKWYQWYYNFLFMGTFFDPSTCRVQNFLHFWTSDGILKHMPVMKIVQTAMPTAK